MLTDNFPQNPPKGYFLTKIFHPNVSQSGDICVNTLKRDWNPQKWSLAHILGVIRCLLIVPFPESSLNEEAGKQFMEDYAGFCASAKVFTEVHAKPTSEQLQAYQQNRQSEEVKENNESSPVEAQVLGQVTNSPLLAKEQPAPMKLAAPTALLMQENTSKPKPKASAADQKKKKYMNKL